MSRCEGMAAPALAVAAGAMERPSNEAPLDHEPIQDRRDDRKDEEDPAGFVEAFDLDPCTLDACRPGYLDLDCFDVPDCAGGLDCVPLDCGL
jgi:hypothetical protein